MLERSFEDGHIRLAAAVLINPAVNHPGSGVIADELYFRPPAETDGKILVNVMKRDDITFVKYRRQFARRLRFGDELYSSGGIIRKETWRK